MLLATVVLSAALAPQAPPAEPLPPRPPLPEAPVTRESAPMPLPEDPAPAMAAEPAPVTATQAPAVSPAAVQDHIDAGLKAFIRGRFSAARGEFEQAYELDPQSAAAAFYLGYSCYKIGEPSRRMDPNKQRARELFIQAYDLDPAFQPVWGQKKQ